MSTANPITPASVLEAMTSAKPAKQAEGAVPPFPLDALPKPLADYVTELHRVERFLPDYTAAGMLFAASTAIGNAVHLKVRDGYHAPPLLWLVAVGPPSIGKTHPMERMLKPLKEKDARTKREHDQAVREWEAADEERRKRKKGEPQQEPPPPRPVWRPHVVGDITMEALVAKLSATPRGLGLHSDELAGWLKRMDQYRSGGDRQAWLTIWNGGQINEVRKTAGEHVVPRSFVALGGGIQPSVLNTLGKDQDGLTVRMLYAFPDQPRKHYASADAMKPAWATMWADVVEVLLALPMRPVGGDLEPVLLVHSKEAAEAYAEWNRTITDRTNEANTKGDGMTSELLGKMETYAHRLALVLELLHRACGNAGKAAEVRPEAMHGALRLVAYFEATARKAFFRMYEADAVDLLTPQHGKLYGTLPDVFTTADALKVAAAHGVSERTCKRLLRRKELFRTEAHGKYRKL